MSMAVTLATARDGRFSIPDRSGRLSRHARRPSQHDLPSLRTTGDREPFLIHVDDAVLIDLRERIAKTRWPTRRSSTLARHPPEQSRDSTEQTLGYALNDSPAGLAAWILEKWRSWGDTHGDLDSRFSRDFLLTNLTIYWATQTITESMRDYFDNRVFGVSLSPSDVVTVPTALARFMHTFEREATLLANGQNASTTSASGPRCLPAGTSRRSKNPSVLLAISSPASPRCDCPDPQNTTLAGL
jgi:hypothetical protein